MIADNVKVGQNTHSFASFDIDRQLSYCFIRAWRVQTVERGLRVSIKFVPGENELEIPLIFSNFTCIINETFRRTLLFIAENYTNMYSSTSIRLCMLQAVMDHGIAVINTRVHVYSMISRATSIS